MFMPERQIWIRFGYDVHYGGERASSPAVDADVDTWTAAQLMAEAIDADESDRYRSHESYIPG